MFKRPLPCDPAARTLPHQRHLHAGEPPFTAESTDRRLELIRIRTIFRVIHHHELTPRTGKPVIEGARLGARHTRRHDEQFGTGRPALGDEGMAGCVIPGLDQQFHVEAALRIVQPCDRRCKLGGAVGLILERDQQRIDRPFARLCGRGRIGLHRLPAPDVQPDAETERAGKEDNPCGRQQAEEKLRRPQTRQTGDDRERPDDARPLGGKEARRGTSRPGQCKRESRAVRQGGIRQRSGQPARHV